MASFDLIRHGEPEGGRRYRGSVDDPLSAEGWRQMNAAIGDQATWDHIYTSPLSRCRAFAVVLGERHGIPVTEDARLQEQGFGAWEGRSREELRRLDPAQLQRFYADPIAHPPEGAEPLETFRQRVIEAWSGIYDRHKDGGQVLMIVHAGIIRAVVSHVLDVPPRSMFRIATGYAGRARIEGDGERPPVLVFSP